MSHPVEPDLLVPRTCTTRDDKAETRTSHPLADFRQTSAYILLGDPGAGKTSSFKQEARATGGHYVTARNFAALGPRPELADKTLFIDGLDEMRAGGGDGRTPPDHVRRHLDRLGRPRFRLSCREADWYGESDRAALREAAPEGSLTVLHLDPLDAKDIRLLLERKFAVADAAGFVEKADRHGLAELLRNPQTLGLLAKAVGGAAWPDSRAATYDLACRQLLSEANPEHRTARRDSAPTHAALLDAAGFLCAVQLLAGLAGFALDDDAADDQHFLWRELIPPPELPLLAALTSGLFQRDEREQQRIPVHRSIAEFLGARYLAELVEENGLPIGRVIALLAGGDGGIIPDLRGLSAWLAMQCRSARNELVDRDPLGVVLYGDVRSFAAHDKQRVLTALKAEAERYPRFRFEDWTASPFGALATPDMVSVFITMIAAPSRSEADIAMLGCVLDALRYGPPLAELATADDRARLEALLEAVARDASYPFPIRYKALVILLGDLPSYADRLVSIAADMHTGTVEDDDDQLLGSLLMELFPQFIGADEVFDFLHPKKQDRLIGDYHMFWSHHLHENAPNEMLPEVLNQLADRDPVLRESLDSLQIEGMAGGLLARVLEVHGDSADVEQVYDWLGTGLDEYEYPWIDGDHQKHVAAWLAARPELYKALVLTGIERCIGKEDTRNCLIHVSSRLFGADPPADIVPWYLDNAATETRADLARELFDEALTQLVRQGGRGWLTPDALDYLAPWLKSHPEFEPLLKGFTWLDIDDWRKESADRRRKRDDAQEQRKAGWRNRFRVHLDAIRKGSAHPQVLHDLAKVYLLKHIDIKGDAPRERLANLLGGDEELITATYAGFRRSLDRNDLPSVAEIVDLETRGHMHFIRQPCLVGMEELYRGDPEAALQLDDEVLRKLIAFRLTWGADLEDGWFTALARMRPDLVAEVFVAYVPPLLRKGREHVYGVWLLAYNEDFDTAARRALPDLLKVFPLRAKNRQLNNILDPLLKASLRYLDRPILAAIVSARLAQRSMIAAQRVYWLACGLMIASEDYERALATHVGTSKALRGHLGAFLHDRDRLPDSITNLPESSLALLIELLAPDSPPEYPAGDGWVSPAMQTADEVRGFIDALAGNPSEAARQQLEHLLGLPQMSPWHDRLRLAAHTQRIARRKASFRHLEAADVCRTLANREPANAADLAALTHTHLRDLARRIRHGSTNDYRQYWSYDTGGKPERPKPENDCRDILLSDLRERMGRFGVDAIKEPYYAQDKRADIRVSYGGAKDFSVPVEIKKDSHSDLWRAMHEQLIERYTREPGAAGFGIYLVFWFGGNKMPLTGGKKPRNAGELEQRLRSTLTADEARHIAVIVIDCALPDKNI